MEGQMQTLGSVAPGKSCRRSGKGERGTVRVREVCGVARVRATRT